MKNARNQGAEKEREKWQGVVVGKDAENAELRLQLEKLQASLDKQ